MLNNDEIKQIEELCKENRRNIIKMVHNAKSGHIGGALSATEIMTVLFHKCMSTAPKWKKDKNYDKRDRFVLSKGHASAIYYSVLAQLGYFPKKELMTFRLLAVFYKDILLLSVQVLKRLLVHSDKDFPLHAGLRWL